MCSPIEAAPLAEPAAQPALVLSRDGRPFTVIMLAAADGKIRSVFMQADVSRLGRVATVLS